MKIDIEDVGSLDRELLIKLTAEAMRTIAMQASTSQAEVIRKLDEKGDFESWKKAFEAYPDLR